MTTEDLMYMVKEQIDVCRTLYPDRVNDILLECYYDLVDLEMSFEED